MKRLLFIFAAAIAFASAPASAADDSIWITTGLVSKHLTHTSSYYAEHGSYRENNVGLGIERGAWSAGFFRNSMDVTSHYAFYSWRPLSFGGVAVGLSGGVMDGYSGVNRGRLFPVVLPTATFETEHVGVNVIFIPKVSRDVDATLGLQLKFRF